MNHVVHFEMPFEDHARMVEFYQKTFGWVMVPLGEQMGDYVLAQTGETDDKQMLQKLGMINGGFFQKSAEGPQHPSVVVSVDNIVAHVELVKKSGGQVLGEPIDIPGVGKYVSFIDTEGNQVSMLQSNPRQ